MAEEVLFRDDGAFLYSIASLDELSQRRAAAWGLDKPASTAAVKMVARGSALAIQVLRTGADAPAAPSAPASAGMVPGAASQPVQVQRAAAAGPALLAICVVDLPYGDESKAGDPRAKLEWFVERSMDSSRFFALRVRRGSSLARLGLGFGDRSRAYAFYEAITEHVSRWSRSSATAGAPDMSEAEAEAAAEAASQAAKADLEATVGSLTLSEGTPLRVSLGGRPTPPKRRPVASSPGSLSAPRGIGAPREAGERPPEAAVGGAPSAANEEREDDDFGDFG